MQTANARVVYNYGEFIISFDEKSGKSQLLTIGGRMAFNNPNQSYGKIMVEEGQFSFVHDSYNHGTPRWATTIGQESFQKMLTLFRRIRPMHSTYYSPRYRPKKRKGRQKRGIASIKQAQNTLSGRKHGGKRGSLIILKNRLKNIKKSVMKIYREKLEQIKQTLFSARKGKGYQWNASPSRPDNIQKTGVKINIFRSSYRPARRKYSSSSAPPADHLPTLERLKPKVGKRAIASLSPVKKQLSTEQKDFEQSLQKAYKKQPRHKGNVNQLIKELESYKKNYQVDY